MAADSRGSRYYDPDPPRRLGVTVRIVRRLVLVVAVVSVAFGSSGIAGAGLTTARPLEAADTSLAPAAIGEPSTLVPLTPARIVDTRSGLGGVMGPIASDMT